MFLGDPTSLQTVLAWRQAIWRKPDPAWTVCGLPAALYSDPGAGFTSEHMAQVCADLNVQLIHSTAGLPRGRRDDQEIFGTATTRLPPTLPGHIPAHNYGQLVTTPTMTLSDLHGSIGYWLTHRDHRRVHPKIDQTPLRRWLGTGRLPRMPQSLEELNLLLLTVATPARPTATGSTGTACAIWR